MRVDQRSEAPRGVTTKETSMEMMWTQAAAAFESICGESLEKGEVKSFEDVQRKIETTCDNASSAESKPEDKWDVAKSVGLKSLEYLKALVVVASQASSLIPIPAAAASITTTALCLVFDIPQIIRGYNEAIDNVFSEVSSALSQFYIYRSTEGLDPVLIRHIHLVLISFVKICAHVVNFRQGRKRDRFWERIKVVFDGNSDLEVELTEFKRLLQGQRDVEGTVTLALLMETKKDFDMASVTFGKIVEQTQQAVQETQKGVQALNDDSDRTKTLTKIRNTLDISSTVHLDTTTTQTCTDLFNKCSANTGSWIWTHHAYLFWTDPKGKDVLVVSGSPSSGKTSVCALITKRLEEQKNRTYVGHYFFPANTKKSNDSKNSVPSCLKYMAFQIARVDAVVRKALGQVCDAKPAVFRPPASLDLYALWKELNIGVAGSSATYYLVFDGIENLPDKEAEMLLKFIFDLHVKTEPAGRVRILVSGKDNLFDTYANTGGMLRIHMEKHNQQDMRVVIQEALDKQKMLVHAKPNSEQEKARLKIVEKIPQKVDGSYSILRLELDRVMRQLRGRTAPQYLDQILDRSTSSHETAIKDLELSLTADEVDELNELLKWVWCGVVYMTLARLESVMVLFSDTVSITALEQVVQTKYSAVLKLENGYVYLQDGVEEYLKNIETIPDHSQRSKDGATISMTISINNADRERCGHFLWDLADMAIRDRFNFNLDSSNANNLHNSRQRTIYIDRLESNYVIIARAFKYLNDEPRDETQDIGPYVVAWLPEHLKRLRQFEDEDEGTLRDDQKSEVGQNLYKIFRDDVVLQRHKRTFQKTFWTAEEIKEMQMWLRDSTVIRKVDRKWRNAIRGASNPINGYLRTFVRVVLHSLLRERDWDVDNGRRWLKEFMSADESKIPQPQNTDTDETEPVDPSPANDGTVNTIDWKHASIWCQEVLGLSDSELDALWYERLADAASSEGQDHNLTTSLYHQAIEKPSPSWRCYRGLGITYRSQGSIADAITQFKVALDRARQEKPDPKPEEKDIMGMHALIGQCAYDNDDLGQAIKHFTALCEGQDLELVTVGQLGRLKATFKRDGANEIVQLLEDIFAGNNEQRMMALAKAMARDYEDDFLVLRMVRVARRDAELLHRILRVIEVTTATIVPSTDQNAESPAADDQYAEEEARGVLLLARGVAAYELRVSLDGTDPTEEALRFWAECRDQLKKVGGQNASLARQHATSALANYYFQEMMDKGPQKEHMATLIGMWNEDSDQENNACAGFLAALHVKNNNKAKAREFLAQRVKQALQILTDDLPENDVLGFSYMFVGMANYQDFENAAIALSLRSTPDIVSSAFRFSAQDFPNFNHAEQQQLLDKITRTAEDIIKATMIQVPDPSEQGLRVQAATTYFESLVATIESKEEPRVNSDESNRNVTNHDTEGPPTEIAIAEEIQFQLIRDRLSKCNPKDHIMFERWVTCDGRNPDRKPCRKNNSKNELFHCVYCMDIDFCRECLTRLRDPGSDETAECNPKHLWLSMPPTGDKMYVGPNAQIVRLPVVKPSEEDRQVLMVLYADEAETISVEAWKEELAKEWDVSLEELKGNISKLSEPESNE